MRSVIAICVVLLMISVIGYSSFSARAETSSGWGVPILIEDENYYPANTPQIAMDRNGSAHAVWSQNDGSGWNIWTKRFSPQSGWGAPSLLSHPFYGPDARIPRIDFNSNGNAVTVWEQTDGVSFKILANYYIDGIGWDYPLLISANDSDNSAKPKIAIDDNGNAIAVWSVDIGPYSNLVASRYESGTGWSPEVPIEFNDSGSAWDPEIAFDGSGNAIVVWTQYNGTSQDIWSNRYKVGSGWDTPESIDSSNGQPYIPQIAVDSGGNAIAVWYQTNVTYTDVWANRYSIGQGWGNAVLLETEDLGSARVPQIVLDEWGDGIAVWGQSNGSAKNIFARSYEFGQGWNATALISSNNPANDAVDPYIAIDGNGNAIVIWKQEKAPLDSRRDLWACRFVKGDGWESPELIETENRPGSSDPAYPDIAMDEAGNAFAIWRHSDGLVDHIWVNRYAVPDIIPPILSITSPEHSSTVNVPVVTVSGATEPGATLKINGILAAVEFDGTFSLEIALLEGNNTITAIATDAASNPTTKSITVTYNPPTTSIEDELNATQEELGAALDDLEATKDELNATSRDVANLKSQSLILFAILAVIVILCAIMSLMYMSLRKKIGEIASKKIEEEPPLPP